MFAYCQSNPITYSDPTGHAIWPCTVAINDGRCTKFSGLDIKGTAKEIVQCKKALNYIKSSESGRALIEKIVCSGEVFTIKFVDAGRSRYYDEFKTLYIDINCGYCFADGISVQSGAVGLAHEMGHIAQDIDGFLAQYDRNNDSDRMIVEMANMRQYETPIARELGEPVRIQYGDVIGWRRMADPTQFVIPIFYPINHSTSDYTQLN